MPRFLLHTLFLTAAVFLAFFWTNHPALSFYTLQLTAAVILLYFINQIIARRHKQQQINPAIDAIILTLIVMLLITSTGGLSSPVFFLIYFLMFGLSLIFEPAITISLSVALAIFFIATPSDKTFLDEVLQLFSLFLITPLALFFGRQYLQVLEKDEKVKILRQEARISDSQIEKEETDILLWVSLNLKKGLTEALDETSNLLSDIGHLTITQKERLLKIKENLQNLLLSGQKLKEEVDKTTDE